MRYPRTNLWAVLPKSLEQEILTSYPDVEVVTAPPSWMSDELRAEMLTYDPNVFFNIVQNDRSFLARLQHGKGQVIAWNEEEYDGVVLSDDGKQFQVTTFSIHAPKPEKFLRVGERVEFDWDPQPRPQLIRLYRTGFSSATGQEDL